jgi:ABC-type transporter Mla subunit MlaD
VTEAHDDDDRGTGASDAHVNGGNLAAAARTRQRRQSVVGALLVLVLLVLALAVFLLDPLVAALRSDREVTVVMRSAPGIVPGAPVWIAGHPVGAVSTVAFMPVQGSEAEPRIALTLAIPTEHAALIRSDARVRITSARLVGEQVIDIEPGSTSAPPLGLRDTLHMARPLSGEQLRMDARELQLALDSLVAAAAPVSARASDRMRALATLQERFAGSQAELARLSDAIASNAARDFAGDPTLARALARLRHATADATARAGDSGGAARVQAALAPLSAHIAQLNEHLAALRLHGDGNGTLARLQNDSALAVALRRTQAQLDSLIAEAKSNPMRFVF